MKTLLLGLALFGGGLTCRRSIVVTRPPPPAKLAIMQGATSAYETTIVALRPKGKALTYRFLKPDGKNSILPQKILKTSLSQSFSPWVLDRFHLSNLSLASGYRLHVEDERGQRIDERSFNTFNPRGNTLTFALASCLDDHTTFEKQQKAMTKAMMDTKPEAIFLIGDNVYSDLLTTKAGARVKQMAKPKQLWQRYVETRRTLPLFKTRQLTPIYAIWDDHDYGSNDSGQDYPYKKQSKAVFQAFFANEAAQITEEAGYGVGYALSLRGQHFFFLDNRSFRNRNGSDGDHFGQGQLRWLYDKLKKKRDGVAYLISGDQFFGGYHTFESYEGNHPASFKRFLAQLKHLPSRVFFLSGDRHLTELMKIEKKHIGYTTYEATSSGFHAKMYPGSFKKWPNPRQLAGKDGTLNFMLIKSTMIQSEKLQIQLKSYGEKKNILFQSDLSIRMRSKKHVPKPSRSR